MRMQLILEIDLIETDTIGHDSGSPYDIVEAIKTLETMEGFRVKSAYYKFESGYSPDKLTEIEGD